MWLFTLILVAISDVFIFIMGFKLRQGKWLRLVAGNTSNKYPKEAKDVAPYIGIICMVISIFILITLILTWYFS
ncbi:hypothetical protein ACWOAH_03315 [Vagococcus vulneris]|uniref:DUF3899 domain-containing protein n=1 Tax=Vagococcus vulneris TaxID=1977869 RepID=A0A429ZXE4_9ENTE|nr:hypothetical protein [Vagococcus vulneris]RST98534.1 hypothetical protein CBF37_07095 [Vagococcus vulneris]